jgi:hypothetical protein
VRFDSGAEPAILKDGSTNLFVYRTGYKTMQQYAGYWINGSALPGPPYTHYWQSEALIYKPGASGSIVRVARATDPWLRLDVRELAEWFALELCFLLVDNCLAPRH